MNVAVPEGGLVRLGQVLDLVLENDGRRSTLEWGRPLWLCTDLSRKVLWLVPAPPSRGTMFPRRPVGELRQLGSVHRLWSDFEPARVARVRGSFGPWRYRGRAVRIGYRSDKWSGKPANYEHDFKGHTRVIQSGRVYRLSGGLAVKPSGITG